jgi:hypothetical protein
MTTFHLLNRSQQYAQKYADFNYYGERSVSLIPAEKKHAAFVHSRGPFLTSPLGANFDPGGEVIPWGVKFSVRPSIQLNSRECSPLGVIEGVNISPRGQISPLGSSSPLGARGEVKNGPQYAHKFAAFVHSRVLAQFMLLLHMLHRYFVGLHLTVLTG